ncbi:PAS domain S-box protein [bacterium]|nr:PAS domain S-box protein [bacterium]
MDKKEVNADDLKEITSLRQKVAQLEADNRRLRKTEPSSGALLQSLAGRIPDLVYRLDTEGRIVYVNEVVSNYGCTPSQLIGKSILDYVHPEDFDLARFRLNERRTGDRATHLFEIRLRFPHGTVEAQSPDAPEPEPYLFTVSAEGLYRSEKPRADTFIGTQGIARDITECKRIKQALHLSENRLLEAQRVAQVGSWELDIRSRALWWSDEVFRIFGFERDKFDGTMETFFRCVHPDDKQMLEDLTLAAWNDRQPFDVDHRIIRPDGEILTVHELAEVTFDDSSLPVRMIGTVQDITDRKAVELALRESEENFRSLYEAISSGVFVQTSDGKLIQANDIALEILGLKAEDFLSRDSFHPSWRVYDDQGNLLPPERHPSMLTLATGKPLRNFPLRVIQGDGQESRWLLVSTQPVFISGGKKPDRVVACLTDITAQKQAEYALEEEVLRRRVLVDQSRDGIVVLDDGGKVFEANRRYAEMLGYTPEEVLQLHVWDWDARWDRGKLLQMIHTVDEKGDFFETRHRRKDGSIFEVEISTNGVLIGGNKYILCICRDITCRKQAEQALRESEGRFHDLFEHAPLGYQSLDEDGRIIEVNEAWLETLGHAHEEVIGKWFGDFLATEYVEAFREQFRRFISAGRIHAEFEMLRKSGERRYIAFEGRVAHAQDGTFKQTHCILLDITESKRAENALLSLVLDTTGPTGTEFFNQMVRWLNRWLGTDIALISESGADGIQRSLAMETDGLPVEHFEYTLAGTPCENASQKGFCHYAESLGHLFPNAKDVERFNIQGYAGIPMRNGKGETLGVICVMSHGNLHLPQWAEPIMSMLSARSAAEFERMRAETRLVHSHTLMRYIIAHAQSAIAVLDRDMRYIFVSEHFLNDYKVKEKDVIGKCHYDVFTDLPVRLREVHRQALAGVVSSADEDPFYREDGSVDWTRWECRPWHEENGAVGGIVLYTEVITERINALNKLRESEERLSFVLSGAGMGWWDWDLAAGKVMRSQGWADLLGYTLEEVQAPNLWNEILHPDDQLVINRILEDHLAGRIPLVEYECRLRTKAGDYIWVLSRGRVVERDAEGTPLRLSGTILNITENKKLEDERKSLERQLLQAQKLESLGVLAGGIAHDFNNILGIISGYTEMAELDVMTEPESALECLQQVGKASERAKSLIEQILAFSRRSEQERRPLKLSLIVKEALKMLRASIPSTVEIRQRVDDNSGIVLADSTQMHQVMMNLATNAAYALRERGGRLTVELMDTELDSAAATVLQLAEGKYVMLVVGDTGQGIAPEIRDRIFDPFFTTKPKGEGTGMGLAVVHGIVRAHGGAIGVESEPGKGSRFTVYLPRITQDSEQEETEVYDDIPGGKESVLLVDDEEGILAVGRMALNRLGYRITVRRSGPEALAAFQAEPQSYDLVITDQTMPGMTGLELAIKILSIRPDLPVIICTGYSEKITPQIVSQYGIKEMILKPYLWDKMARVIRRILDRR